MKKVLILIITMTLVAVQPLYSFAAPNLAERLAGKILLEVESHGEAWYINLSNLKRYYLGRPADAFSLMRDLGIGITNADLEKISIGLLASDAPDSDGDGLSDDLEIAINTNTANKDSDNDDYSDKTEIENNYTPLGQGKMNTDGAFASANAGKIFLQTEKNGEAWYVNPADKKRYFLARPADAFNVMRSLSLGITNADLNQIPTGHLSSAPAPNPPSAPIDEKEVIAATANAIMAGDTTKTLSYFTPEMQKPMEYTMNFLNSEGKFTLGNILAGAQLSSSTDNEKNYSTSISFSGYTVILNFRVKKQTDGKWLLANL